MSLSGVMRKMKYKILAEVVVNNLPLGPVGPGARGHAIP